MLVLCVCMLAIASGCAKEPAPSGASASGGRTFPLLQPLLPAAPETAGPISPSEDDSMLFDFENAETDIFYAKGIYPLFGIPFAEIEIAQENADTGKRL